MTTEEFEAKEFVNEGDLAQLSLEQMQSIANEDSREYLTSETKRAYGRKYGKMYRAKIKAQK